MHDRKFLHSIMEANESVFEDTMMMQSYMHQGRGSFKAGMMNPDESMMS